MTKERWKCPKVRDVYDKMQDGPIREIVSKQLEKLYQITPSTVSNLEELIGELNVQLKAARERDSINSSLESMGWYSYNIDGSIFVGSTSEHSNYFLEKLQINDD